MRMAGAALRGRTRRALAMLIAIALAMLSLGLGVAPALASPLPAIAGSVVDADGAFGIDGATVTLYAADDTTTVLQQTITFASGNFVFGSISDGDYVVTVTASGYAPQTSATFEVIGSNVTVPTFAMVSHGVLSGTVENYDGSASITVVAGFYSSGDWTSIGSVQVQPDGTYSIAAVTTPGSYDLEFEVGSYAVPFLTTWYGDLEQAPDPSGSSAGVITATQSQTIIGLNVDLTPAGYITGTVKSGGKPVSGVEVDAFDNVLQNEYDAVAPSSSTGAYKIKVPAATPLQVETDGNPPYDYQTWNGHNGCGCNYDPVTVTAGTTKTGINFSLLKNPLEILTQVIGDDGSGTPEPFPGATVKLYRQVTGGYQLVDSQDVDSGTGESEFVEAAGGNMRFRVMFTDPSTNKVSWLPIEAYIVVNSDSSTPPTIEAPSTPVCSIDVAGMHPGDEWAVLMEVVPDTTTCGPEPAIKKHTGTLPLTGGSGTESTTTSAVTSTPTPTPTPTETSAPSPAPSPSAAPTATPKPAPVSTGGGLPWWVWLLIVVGVLVLIGIGVAIFRVRA